MQHAPPSSTPFRQTQLIPSSPYALPLIPLPAILHISTMTTVRPALVAYIRPARSPLTIIRSSSRDVGLLAALRSASSFALSCPDFAFDAVTPFFLACC